MDEPLGALDRKLRDHMQMEIKQLHKQLGITVLYVTHDQEEAMAMSDRICLMHNGRIAQLGSPEELYFRPNSVFVADFLGESNIIDAKVIGAGADGLVELAGGLRVRAAVAPALPVGMAVKLMLRPESLRLLQPGETSDNMAEGTLTETVFIGGIYRHFVTIAGDVVLSLKQFTDPAIPVPPLGSALRVGWRRDQAVMLSAA
jgi:putative spermidine/putrescine transport system ATP-binding protein